MEEEEKSLLTQSIKSQLVVEVESNKIQLCTDNVQSVFGYSEDELKLLELSDLVPCQDKKLINAELIRTRKRLVRRFETKSGCQFLGVIKLAEQNNSDSKSITFSVETKSLDNYNSELNLGGLIYDHISKSKLGFIIWDGKLQVIQWSVEAERITGFKLDEVHGTSVFDLELLPEKGRKAFKERLFLALENGRDNFKIKTNIISKNGAERFVRLHFSILWDSSGMIHSMMCTFEDITEGFLKDQQLKESEQRYRFLFEKSTEGVFIYKNGTFFDCNKRSEELFGTTREGIIGKGPSHFSPEFQPGGGSSVELAEKHIQKALKNDHHFFEWQHKKESGELIDTIVSLTSVKVSGEHYIQAIIKDITERKKYERKLRESENMFRNLFINSPTAIVMVNADNIVEMVNDSFVNLFKYEREELLGQELDPLIVASKEMQSAPRMPAIGLNKEELTQETIRYDKDGNELSMIVSGIPVYLDGNPFKGFGMYVNITDLKEKEKSLEKSLSEKRILLAEIHHRVKNNLALISSLLQLQIYSIPDMNTRELLKESESRIRSIAAIHEILYQNEDFSKIPSTQFIHGIIGQVLSNLPREIHISINSGQFDLNINQAIPLGMLINELFIEYGNRGKQEKGDVELKFSKYDQKIQVEITNKKPIYRDEEEEKGSENLSGILIETLLKQLEARITKESGEVNIYTISFEAKDIKGSASSIRLEE